MITSENKVYVFGKGFTELQTISPGDMVYSLAGQRVEVAPIEKVECHFISANINSVVAGQQNVDATDDARFLYHSDKHGVKYASFREIPNITPNKEMSETKYLPVLTHPYFQGERRATDSELEYLARMLAAGGSSYNLGEFIEISQKCTGEDALVFTHLVETWLSISPGQGNFGRVHVKSRMHIVYDRFIADEVIRLALLAGYTCTEIIFPRHAIALKISYESMPVPGSIPKNQKYKKAFYRGLVYNIMCEGNRPIMGKSRGRYFYLPTTSTLNS